MEIEDDMFIMFISLFADITRALEIKTSDINKNYSIK